MLKILAQTVCNSVLLALVLSTVQAQAKDIPIVKQITIVIPLKEFSVIEFPFEIKKHDFTPFVSMAKESSILQGLQESTEQQEYALPNIDDKKLPNNQNPIQGQQALQNAKTTLPSGSLKKPIDVEKGKNFFKLYPRKIGDTELLVFGYSKYPIIIKIKVSDDKEQVDDKTFKFIDYDEHKEQAQKFESSQHDKVVINLTKALYNNELPKGYTEITTQREMTSQALHFRLIKEYQGKLYSGLEYLVTNKSSNNIILSDEIIRGQKGIYGTTFTHDILEPNMQTRLFLVKQRGADE